MKCTLFLTATAAMLAASVSAAPQVKARDSGNCTLGSQDTLQHCGKCAGAIADCAVNAETSFCIKDIGSFAGDCGPCAEKILACL